MPNSIPRINKGEAIKASFLNLVAAEAERMAKIRVSGGLQVAQSAYGVHISRVENGWFYARILGGNNPYAWEEVMPGVDYTKPDIDRDRKQYMSGRRGTIETSTTKQQYAAYEVNSNPTVPPGTVVRIRTAPGFPDFIFQWATCHYDSGNGYIYQ